MGSRFLREEAVEEDELRQGFFQGHQAKRRQEAG
jgi:hypothetical protein